MIPNLIRRSAWEEPGWTIDEHTGSGPHPFSRTVAVIIHYTAASSTPENEASVRDYIRRTQRDYAVNRGYSIGYNWCVDRQGRIWELRGEDYKCAANGSATANDDPAILCLVNGADPANAPMIAGVHDVIEHVERITGRALTIKGHRDVRATGCPGDGLYAQVIDGTFRPQPPEPPTEDDDMPGPRYIRTPPPKYKGGPFFFVWDGSVRYADGGDVEFAKANGIPVERDPIADTEPAKAEERYELLHLSVMGSLPKAQ